MKKYLVFLFVCFLSVSQIVWADQPDSDDDNDGPIVTNPSRDHQVENQDEDSPISSGKQEQQPILPINFELRNVSEANRPNGLNLSNELVERFNNLSINNFPELPARMQNFIIQGTENDEDREYFENLKNNPSTYGPQLDSPPENSNAIRELAQQGRDFWSKVRVKKCGLSINPVTGQKLKRGWCIQFRQQF